MVSLSGRLVSLARLHPVREWFGAFIWVAFSLATFTACNSPSIRSFLSIPSDTSTESLFLASVAGQVALWDYFDIALGLTLNPALALAFLSAGRISTNAFAGVLAGQFLGHIMAVRATRAIVNDYFVSKVRLFAPPEPLTGNGMSFVTAVAMEASLTCVLAFAALSIDRIVRGQRMQSLVMMCVIVLITAVGQGYTGAMLNPAMVLALAVFEAGDQAVVRADQVVYWVGPVVGALAGAALHRALFHTSARETRRQRIIRKQQAEAGAKVE